MEQILDLHIHSQYSRACSRDLNLENIDKTCGIKGIDIIATGDFTHPSWFKLIKNELAEINSSGLYSLKKNNNQKIKFILGTEVSLIYKDKIKCRRIHLCLFAPNIKAVEELNNFLEKNNYNLRSDGRPILGMSAPTLVEICLKINPRFLIIPAHIWTPWFSLFGSKSGFDKLEECFENQAKNIFGYETGLSSDPAMNWRISELDNLTLLSNSDAHSLGNIGREANIFDLEKIDYKEIYDTIKNKDLKKIKSTIEFYPEEGMYHIDGHRACGFSSNYIETKKLKGLCQKCAKPLVIGVEYRVDELADRADGFRPEQSYDYIKLVGLEKIIAETFNLKTTTAKKVNVEYDNLINQAGTELDILQKIDLAILQKITTPRIVEGIERVREGKVLIQPGFDGQYGEVKIFSEDEKIKHKKTPRCLT
ncbi:MAG: endonuclease Q family protein [Candidatus Falkowbacteria bacterium]|nr:endonuclease Q family protein [Candidatus Falkowbacteria bacterium]